MLTTTLTAIREHSPCSEGWRKLLAHLGKTEADDEPLTFATIVESNGLDDALWACRSAPQYAKEWRLFAVWCARQVQHLATDTRSITALNVAEKFARGEATQIQLAAAREAAGDAAWAAAREAAWAAWAAAGDAAWAAAREAAWAAAREAAGDAAREAAWAAWAAGAAAGDAAREAAWAAAREAAWAAAWAAAGDAQKIAFLRIANGDAP